MIGDFIYIEFRRDQYNLFKYGLKGKPVCNLESHGLQLAIDTSVWTTLFAMYFFDMSIQIKLADKCLVTKLAFVWKFF